MKLRHVVGTVAAAAMLMAPAAAYAAGAETDGLTTTYVDGTKVSTVEPIQTADELEEFVLSSTPKTMTLDAATGQVETVTEGAVEPSITPLASVRTTCKTGDACLVASAVPYANFGFYGEPGSKEGPWTHRIEWRTGSYTAKAWYTYNGDDVGWGPKSGPNSIIRSDRVVTAVKVRLY